MGTILVTGSSGNVGREVAAALAGQGAEVRTTHRPQRPPADPVGSVAFDFLDATTWASAFAGVESVFLVRPPALGNVRRDLLPAVAAARDAGVRHVVFLSLQGAERLRVVPHAAVEQWLRGSGLAWTSVRASFFNQNLSGTHAADVRERDALIVPAGSGATAFVDAEDVGAVAAAALLDPARHAGRAWTVTGPESLTYDQVAVLLSAELGRAIVYARPGLSAYARHAHGTLRMPWPMVAVTAAIYTTARLGLAAALTDDVRTVLGRDPNAFAAFAHRERGAWLR